jgi:hypothetical protein
MISINWFFETLYGEFGRMAPNEAGDLKNVPYTLANLMKDNDTFQLVPYAIL